MEALINSDAHQEHEVNPVPNEGRLYVLPAHATGGYGDASYCAFLVTPAFIARLTAVAAICKTNGLSEARFYEAPQLWGPAGIEEELRLHCAEVVVTIAGDFWFTDTPKHGDYLIQSDSWTVDELAKVLDEETSEIAFHDDDCRDAYEEDHVAV